MLKVNLSFRAMALLIVFFPIVASSQGGWAPVDQAELAMAKPVIEPTADAEALQWEVRIVDEYFRTTGFKTTLEHYLRVKIFTERGREAHAKFDIPYGRIKDLGVNVSIRDIAARSVKPNGTIVEVDPKEIFDQQTVRADGIKWRSKSFAMPAVEVGSIVEYRWKEIRTNSLSNYVRIHFSRDIPVHSVKYLIKPARFTYGLRVHSMNIPGGFAADKDGFYSATMTSVPAFKAERNMVSEYEFRPWSLIYYGDPELETGGPEKYWAAIAKRNHAAHKAVMKTDGAVKQTAASLTAKSSDIEGKVRLIHEFCRRNIKDINDDASGLASSEIRQYKPNIDSVDTLKKKVGDWHDIALLFASMLNAVGIDARIANVAMKTDATFDRSRPNDYFLRTELVAVKVGSAWKYFEFSNKHLPYGMVPTGVEGQTALIYEDGNVIWDKVPVSAAADSVVKRSAVLAMDPDGMVSGPVKLEYTGHNAGLQKELLDDDSDEKRHKAVLDMVKRLVIDTAEVSGISIEGLNDFAKPLTVAFQIRVPAYSQRTGKRFFLRPNIFERNSAQEFTSSIRNYDVSFPFRWIKEDVVTIRIPAGSKVESLEAPGEVRDEQLSLLHSTTITFDEASGTVRYDRKVSLDGKNGLVFDRSAYSRIKQAFDAFHTADSHAVSLTQGQ